MNIEIQAKVMLQNMLDGRASFINFEQAVLLTRDWIKRFPCRYDLVIGVPRTGLTIAGIISDELAIPLSTPGTLPEIWKPSNLPARDIQRILLVEDCTARLSHLFSAKQKVREAFPEAEIHLGSLFSNGSQGRLDTYGSELRDSCIFEWELMNIEFSRNVASDLDGVICQDWPKLVTEDDRLDWMRTVKPYLIPVYGLSAIITSRPEKYRDITTQWLNEHGVRFCRLVMDQTIEGQYNDYLSWKVYAINRIKPGLFLESNDETAKAIHYKTGVTVICTDTMKMYSG